MALQPHLVTGGSTDSSVNVKILCYADDTLVFIKNLQDFSRLKHHIEVYSRSSNARINYNKLETISLSGRDHSSYWERDLTDMNIPRIHLPTNPDPIVYLGFPLIQSSLQRRAFMSQFTNKIKQIALLHSTRSLSILGRAAIVNSLLPSMCWYLFRVTPITKSDISNIRSVVSKFMNQGIFPRIKWSILTLPKQLGGLNLIDPHIQQAALYFRWIQPLLVTRQRSRPSKVTRLLRIHLKNTYNTQHHEIPLLFQDGRKSTQLRLFNICNLLTKSIDLIPRNFSTMELNPHACLLLPIQDIFMHPEQRFKFPSICGQMKDLFQYNPQTHTIASIPHADMDNRFKRAANKIFRGVEASKLFLSYFFAQFYPIRRLLAIHTSTKSFTDVTTKICRKTCNQLNPAPNYLTDILPQRWLAFWSLHLTATQRNVIYRLINKKIPHKDILHKFFPDKFDTPNCSFCASTVDSLQHFLFDCPAKQVVWQGLVREFLWPTVDTQDIFKAFTTLDHSSYCQSSDITAESVLIIASWPSLEMPLAKHFQPTTALVKHCTTGYPQQRPTTHR
ncbi:hypothetical protein G6F17_000531 [Rhizopus arrhizus]|nr:hypothetical protein G6F17_000531 [Rhizopus arrhizus]KAG1114443.1 hypothetical protein G6F40_005174 [Rhizopus arrhizus]